MDTEIRIRDVSEKNSRGILKFYRTLCLAAAVLFMIAGFLFLLIPGGVLAFFNRISQAWGLKTEAIEVPTLYLALTVAYTYTVTLLALKMYNNPVKWIYPFLLAQAKGASSLLSLALFVLRQPSFVLLANFAVDGFIAVAAYVFYRRIKRQYP